MTPSPRKRPAAFFRLSALLRSERGATAIEYGLIMATIMLAAFAAIQGLGDGTNGMWSDVDSRIANTM